MNTLQFGVDGGGGDRVHNADAVARKTRIFQQTNSCEIDTVHGYANELRRYAGKWQRNI